jgi:VIT1/CCC1 family predicted Fe2+/Mn2+ transporter
MSTDTEDSAPDIPPSPFPDVVVYAWLSLLEGSVAAGLTIFSIALLEGGNLIPNVLEEWTVGLGVFVVVSAGLLVRRQYLT